MHCKPNLHHEPNFSPEIMLSGWLGSKTPPNKLIIMHANYLYDKRTNEQQGSENMTNWSCTVFQSAITTHITMHWHGSEMQQSKLLPAGCYCTYNLQVISHVMQADCDNLQTNKASKGYSLSLSLSLSETDRQTDRQTLKQRPIHKVTPTGSDQHLTSDARQKGATSLRYAASTLNTAGIIWRFTCPPRTDHLN